MKQRRTIPVKLCKGTVLDLASEEVAANGFRVFMGGESGSGKSSAIALIVEQAIAAGVQVVLLDAHGEYGQLFALNPGTVQRIGYGSEPVAEGSAEWCAQLVQEGRSLLVDLKHWTDIEPAKLDAFMLEFLKALYRVRRERPKFTLVVVEEAHNIAPQMMSKGQDDNVRIVVGMLTGGRKFGVHFLLASQQQQLVDVRALAACNMRMFFRVSDVKDWKKIKPYVPEKLKVSFEGGKNSIRNFQNGECVLSSRWLGDLRLRLDMPEVPPEKFLEEES